MRKFSKALTLVFLGWLLVGCAPEIHLKDSSDLRAATAIRVVRLENPELYLYTAAAPALAASGIDERKADARDKGENFRKKLKLPDFGKMVMLAFSHHVRKKRPTWPRMMLVSHPFERRFFSGGGDVDQVLEENTRSKDAQGEKSPDEILAEKKQEDNAKRAAFEESGFDENSFEDVKIEETRKKTSRPNEEPKKNEQPKKFVYQIMFEVLEYGVDDLGQYLGDRAGFYSTSGIVIKDTSGRVVMRREFAYRPADFGRKFSLEVLRSENAKNLKKEMKFAAIKTALNFIDFIN